MSLRHVDSFAHYSLAQITRKYSYANLNGGTITTPGRYGAGSSYAYVLNGNTYVGIGRVMDAQATWGVAMGVATVTAAPWGKAALFTFFDAGTAQLTIGVDAQGHPVAWRGTANAGVLLGTGSAVLPGFQAWCHVEAKVTIDNAAGSVNIWVNGVLVLALVGVDTQVSANATANEWRINGDGAIIGWVARFADLVVYDGQAGVTGPVGDCRVQAILPTGPGNYTQFATLVGAATQWEAVSENPATDDTSYIGSTTPAEISSFATANLVPTGGSIVGVAVTHTSRKDDAGARTVAGFCRSAAVDAAAAGQAVTDSFLMYQDVFEKDPSAANWTIATVNGAEFGVKEIA